MINRRKKQTFFHRYINKIFLILAVVMVLSNCASVMNPEGGPLDESPPSLVGTQPEILINVKPEQKITIRLSEYLKESSIKNAINIFPMYSDKIQYEFRGDKIDVWLPSNLSKNTTYMIVLNTTLADEHGVEIKTDISIPFTSDSVFDSSMIKGTVYGDFDHASILLWRGILDYESMLSTDPDYIANTTSDDSYTFKYLPSDNFSILAVEQYGSNIDYSKGRYAFYHKNLLSTKETNLKNIDFFLHQISDSEVLDIDSLGVVAISESNIVKTADISGVVKGKFLHPIKMLLQNSSHSYVQAVNLDGSYTINDIIAGEYQLLIYEDRNNNNKLDTGSFLDKIQSEEFYAYSDSLSCRSNWELELPLWKYQQEIAE